MYYEDGFDNIYLLFVLLCFLVFFAFLLFLALSEFTVCSMPHVTRSSPTHRIRLYALLISLYVLAALFKHHPRKHAQYISFRYPHRHSGFGALYRFTHLPPQAPKRALGACVGGVGAEVDE